MPWPIHDIPRKPDPAPISAWFWGITFIIVIFGGMATTLLFWTQYPDESDITFAVRLILLPLMVFTLLFGIRISIFSAQESFAKAWDGEIEKAYDRYRVWAKHHFFIIDTAIITPHQSLASRIRGESGPKAPFMPGECRPIPPVQDALIADTSLPRDIQLWIVLLQKIKPSLLLIQHEGTLEIMLSGALNPYDAEDNWRTAWDHVGLDQTYVLTLVRESQWDMKMADEWLESDDQPFRLLVATDIAAGQKLDYTETGQVILLSPVNGLLTDPPYAPVATLYRPMFSSLDEITDDLKQLNDFGAIHLSDIDNCWIAGLPDNKRSEVIEALNLAGMRLRSDDRSNRVFFLEDYLGIVGNSYPLTLLSLATENIYQDEASDNLQTKPQLLMVYYQQTLMLALFHVLSRKENS